jgi:hypothetical protein
MQEEEIGSGAHEYGVPGIPKQFILEGYARRFLVRKRDSGRITRPQDSAGTGVIHVARHIILDYQRPGIFL